MRARSRVAVFALAALTLLVAACVPQGAAAPTATTASAVVVTPSPAAAGLAGGSFRYGIGQPTAITAPAAVTADDRAVVDALYDSLTAWDDAGRALSSAAVSWSVDAEARRWTFTLRPGAAFHDGTPVTAADFVRGWDLLAAEGGAGYLLQDVAGYADVRRGETSSLAGVEAVGLRILDVTLTAPRADFAVVAGHPGLGPLHPDHDVDPVGHGQQPIGNGPFRMSEPWTGGDFIRASRWDGWLNGPRSADGIGEVVFRIADLDINFLAFTQGRRDFTAVPPEALDLAAEEFPVQGGTWDGPGLITGGRPEVYLLAINPAVVPYDDLRVRQAVSLVVDRPLIAEDNGGGNLSPATSLLPPALPGVRTDVCDWCTFNPVGADNRLEAAGVTQLSLAFNAGGGHERIRDEIRSALSAIGVSLVSNERQLAPSLEDYQRRLAEGGVGLFRLPLSADVPSSLSLLRPLLHPDQTPEQDGQNYLGYDDPTVTALLDQAARTVDDQLRERLVRRVEDIVVNRDVVAIPVVSYRHAMVAASQVQGLRYGPFGLLNLTELSLTP
ncbi:N/A [soil metagenome]